MLTSGEQMRVRTRIFEKLRKQKKKWGGYMVYLEKMTIFADIKNHY